MKPSLRILRILTTVWTVVIFIIIALMFIPVVPGVVEVSLPPSDSWTSSIDNQTVTMTNNLSIRNGGLFPFNNFFFVIKLYGDNGSTLAEFSSTETDLRTNAWVQIPLTFEINRSNIDDNKLRNMLFDTVTFGGLIYFNTNYLLNFRAQLGVNGSVSLGPIIKQANFDLNRTAASLVGDNATLDIPYSINSSILGSHNLSISGTISNETQELGTFDHSFAPGQVRDNLTVNLSREAYDHLTTSSDHLIINATVTLDDFVWTYQTERDWQPPARG
jgi:hypothetical protein